MTDALALCSEFGCPRYVRLADDRHVRNFEGRWRCPDHDSAHDDQEVG